VKFVSYEPALGPVDWSGWEFVNQIIGGGESGPRARPMHPAWQRATRDFCAAQGIAYFFKQHGEFIAHPAPGATWPDGQSVPADLEPVTYERVGKKAAGRLLDGIQHDGMPS
jgi:protein gp37